MTAASSGGAVRAECGVLRALAEYDLGEVLSAEPLPAGSDVARKVITTRGAYVLKPVYRSADVELQAEVAPLLTARGIRQPAVARTTTGAVSTASGHFLQEFLPGTAPAQPGPDQIAAAMRHVGRFHRELGLLPVRYAPVPGSVWTRVADPGFLVASLPGLLRSAGPDIGGTDRAATVSAIRVALAHLTGKATALAALPRQVVHGDIGPDNVLMDGAQVVALIDFTPHQDSVLFAASTALYWYHVFGQAEVSADRLRASLAALGEARPWTGAELALWPAGLVRESLRRLATPLELARESGTAPGPSAGPRLAAVRAVVALLPELGGS